MQLESVKTILGDVLSLGPSAQARTRGSMAVVRLLAALEEHYGITIEDDDISAHTFATVGSLTDFVTDKMAA